MTDLAGARWRKSSRSGAEGSCVEVAGTLPAQVAVRDSKDPHGPALAFTTHAWRDFVRSLSDDARPK
nr:DUF397 domain-containing protein [Micromonospora sp. DSM 115978]